MASLALTAQQVKEARRRAWNGEAIRAIARDLGESYHVVWTAVRRHTWHTIQEPPPVPFGSRRRPVRVCGNPKCRKKYQKGGTRTRCPACYSYWYKHRRERDPKARHQTYIHIDKEELAALWRRYEAGESTIRIAKSIGVSEMTINRRFHEAGYKLRKRTEHCRKLTPALVRQLRHLVHVDGWTMKAAADHAGVNYNTAVGAILWKNWRSAGGPMPGDYEATGKRPCPRCGLLTPYLSGLCHYCREEQEQCR